MALSYRPLPDDDAHRTAFRRMLQYAFRPEEGPEWDDEEREHPPEFEPRGLYAVDDAVTDDSVSNDSVADLPTADNLVTCAGLICIEARVRGGFRPVAEVTAVASPPEHRRRGNVGVLLDHLHTELRDRDIGVAMLWPFAHPFYRRFGYGRTNDYVLLTFPPDALSRPTATPSTDEGVIHPLTSDHIPALAALHERAADEPLTVRRSADWWRLRILRGWTKERYAYGWTDDEGTLRSYLAYEVEEANSEKTLAVWYWGATDDEALRQLLAFLRNHDSQVSRIRLTAPDVSLFDRLSDPDDADVEATVKAGPMARIVDVERALTGLSTSARGDEPLSVRVRDDRHAWNDGIFEVGVDDGEMTCRRADDAAVGDDSRVDVDVAALSRLVVGARSVGHLHHLGQVDGNTDSLARLGALFPVETPSPYLREWF